MRRIVIGIGLVLAVLLAWWWLRAGEVEVSWQPEWPKALRATGESVERIVSTGRLMGASEGDRARAGERARWKAYYVAQLRVAEQLGGMKLAAGTTLRDLALVDQELRSTYEGTIRAAAEVPGEARLEQLKDAVRAKVVVEVPSERLARLREWLLAAVRGGRFSLKSGPRPTLSLPFAWPAAAQESGAEDRGDAPPVSQKKVAAAEGADSTAATAATSASAASAVAAPPRKESATGVLLEIAAGSGLLGASPVVFDAAGTRLGSSFDLPAERLAAGLPIATDAADPAVKSWAGARPRRYEATVSKKDLFLTERLAREEIDFFRESLTAGRIVVVLGKETS